MSVADVHAEVAAPFDQPGGRPVGARFSQDDGTT
jgi:hypothetical protein